MPEFLKHLARSSRIIGELFITRGQGGLRGVRRFMAIGFVIALVLLLAEMMVLYASAHPGFLSSSSGGTQNMIAPIPTQTGTTVTVTDTPSVAPTTAPARR